jgi:hypothetical protein
MVRLMMKITRRIMTQEEMETEMKKVCYFEKDILVA